MVGGITTLTLVREAYQVKKGDWILVHAAAGGTGLLLGQVLKDIGAHSIGTVSTKEKGKLAKEAGFEHIIESYDPDTVLSKVKELTNGIGVIAVYDGVPPQYTISNVSGWEDDMAIVLGLSFPSRKHDLLWKRIWSSTALRSTCPLSQVFESL